MPGFNCKAAQCSGGCLASITTSEFFEQTVVFRELAACGELSKSQLTDGIEIYETFDSASFTNAEQRKFERKAAKKIKQIVLREV